jgi:hypothetical protein
MKPNLRAPSRAATNVLCALFAVVAVFAVAGCGDGGGDGAEDTGTIIQASVSWPDPQTRNIDIAADFTQDDDPDNDVFLSDDGVTVDFVSTSVVPPDPNTGELTEPAVDVRVESYTIEYFPSPNNPSAPALAIQRFDHTFVIPADGTVSRGDIIVVALTTADEYAHEFTGTPLDPPDEYTAHYTFYMESIPFGESMTVTVDVPISFADFVESE